jgi:hypothetical protein
MHVKPLIKSCIAPDLPSHSPLRASTTRVSSLLSVLLIYSSAGITDLDAAFLNSTGYPLSDHYPITTSFSYSLSTSRRLTDLVGGTGGTWFSDLASLPATAPTVSSITLSGANRLDYISLTLSTGTVFRHGGTGGTPISLTLNSGERITSLRVDTGSYNGGTRVFYVAIGTSSGRTLSAGTQTSSTVTWTAPSGFGLKGVYGRAGDGLDLLGGVWA